MKRRSAGSLFSLYCGCRDSKSVSVSDVSDRSIATPHPPRDPPSSSAEALTLTTASSSSPYCWEQDDDDEAGIGNLASPSFSELLLQLSELERNVKALKPGKKEDPRHRRCRSEMGSGRVRESVAVMTETADPLGDFRRSMLQMIVEKEIVGRDELRELLLRFIALNSPRHHDVILRAFADIWVDVFSGLELTPDLLRPRRR